MIELVQRVLNLERRMEATRKIDRSLGDVISPFLALPELRGFWPLSSVNETGNPLDLSGQARTLTNTGTTPRAIYNSLINYFDFDGATQYLTRADEAGLSITGALTVGGWFWKDTAGSADAFISKFLTTGNQRTFMLSVTAGETLQFQVSSDGTATTVVSHGTAAVTGQWYFLVGRYTPSTEIAIFSNNVKATNTTTIPAAIFDSTAALNVGARNSGAADFLDGRAALCFLCADDLSDTLIDLLWQSSRGYFGV